MRYGKGNEGNGRRVQESYDIKVDLKRGDTENEKSLDEEAEVKRDVVGFSRWLVLRTFWTDHLNKLLQTHHTDCKTRNFEQIKGSKQLKSPE